MVPRLKIDVAVSDISCGVPQWMEAWDTAAEQLLGKSTAELYESPQQVLFLLFLPLTQKFTVFVFCFCSCINPKKG